MRTVLGVILSGLFLSGVTATAFPFGESYAAVGTKVNRQGSDLAGKAGREALPSAGGCPDLANTEIFQSKGLGYVGSQEFADAVRAVATGVSKYSPPDIPASWREDAEKWIRPGSDALLLHKGVDACNPTLVYLASLEYRSRTGHGNVTPVFPRNLQAATREARVVAELKKTGPFAERAAAVEFKIAIAERMGAKECAKSDLESAKLLLNRARNVAAASRNKADGAKWLDRAEKNADSLLANRQFAFRQGVMCTETSN